MANPTTLTNRPAVLQAFAIEQSVAVEPGRSYALAHDGENTDGGVDLNTIYFSFAADVDADESEGQDKFKLTAGRSVDLPKGIALLKFATETGSPTFSVVPLVT